LVIERFLSSGGTPMTIDPAVRRAGRVTGASA
jgi:hypothetical protein